MGEESRVARYTAEFIGTYLLVFTVGCNVLGGNAVWAATSIAAILMVSIYALAGSSGANFNPAVSLALGISGKMAGGWMEVGIYMVVQIVAGVLAGLSYGALFWKVMNLEPNKGFGWWEAGLAEFIYTFMLCFVVLNCAASKRNNHPDAPNQFYGLAIGFVIVAGGYAAGSISGGAFNPAVAMGIDISSAGLGVFWCFIYTIYEFAGAIFAAGLFRVVRPDEYNSSVQEYSLITRAVSEFIGTFILVVTVGLNVLGSSPAGAWSIAAALMCMIFSLGDVSGAHFNPAVTVAILLSGRRKIPFLDAGVYIVCQIVGGVVAAFTYAAMHHGSTFALEPKEGYAWPAAIVGEVVFTFVLCFVVLGVATVENSLTQFCGLAIGSCVTAGGLAIGNISGGSLNPAVSIGISSSRIMGGGLFYNCLVYSGAELVGAGLAAGFFYATHPSEYGKSKSSKHKGLLAR